MQYTPHPSADQMLGRLPCPRIIIGTNIGVRAGFRAIDSHQRRLYLRKSGDGLRMRAGNNSVYLMGQKAYLNNGAQALAAHRYCTESPGNPHSPNETPMVHHFPIKRMRHGRKNKPDNMRTPFLKRTGNGIRAIT